MATNLALDDQLIDEAVELGKHKTKREAVNAALLDYVKRKRQSRILDLMGTIDFDPTYDYKAAGDWATNVFPRADHACNY